MIGPDLRSSAFQALSALAVTENRSARGNMAPVERKTASGYRSNKQLQTLGLYPPLFPTPTLGLSPPRPRRRCGIYTPLTERVGGMQNISRSSSSSTSSPSNAIFAQDGHRPSNHCIKTATRPQAQLKTATGQRDDGGAPFFPRTAHQLR